MSELTEFEEARLRRRRKKNWRRTKKLAIVLAVGVWMYVINVENPSGTGTVREIPVTVVGEV